MDCSLSSKAISHCFHSGKLDSSVTFADHICSFSDQQEWKCSVDFFPQMQQVYGVDPDRLFQWLQDNDVDKWMGDGDLKLLSKQISNAVKPFFSGVDKYHQVFIPPHIAVEKDTPVTPQVLFSKVCKEGEKLKIGLNVGLEVRKGSRVKVYKVPEVVLDLDGTFELRPKALIVHQRGQNWEKVLDLMSYEEGIAIVKELFDGDTLPVFFPRRLEKFPGCYIQHYFKGDLLDLLIYDSRRMIAFPIMYKLQVIEDLTRYVDCMAKGLASHHDVKPENVVAYPDRTGRLRGCLIDYNACCELGTKLFTSREAYAYLSQRKGGLRWFPATPATDLCGLAQTLAETFFPNVTRHTAREIWLEKPEIACLEFMLDHYRKNKYRAAVGMQEDNIVDLYDMADPPLTQNSLQLELWVMGKVSSIVEKIFRADMELAKRFPTQESVEKADPVAMAEEFFREIDACWVAEELKKLKQAIQL